MKNRQNIKALDSIFAELDSAVLSNNEMDDELKQIGINPTTLISEGMTLVRKFSRTDSLGSTFQHHPMAASKPISIEPINKSIKTKGKRRGKGKSKN